VSNGLSLTTKKSVTPEISNTFCKSITGEYRDGGGWQEGRKEKTAGPVHSKYAWVNRIPAVLNG